MENEIKPQQNDPGTDQTVPGLASAVTEGQGGEASLPAVGLSEAFVQKRKPHEVLAKELGISDKTVREKRKLGMSDEDIAVEAQVNSTKHDPLKYKREVELPLLDLALSDAQPEAASGQLRVENLRARRLSNEQEELKLRKLKGDAFGRQEILEAMLPVAMAVKDACFAMVEKLAPRVATMSDPSEIRRLMMGELIESLNELERVIRSQRPNGLAA